MALTCGLSIFSFDQQRRIVERDVERRAMTIAEHVGLSSLKAIVSGNTLSLNDIIEESMTDKNVLYAMVLDAAGHVRMHNEEVNIGRVFDDDLTKKAIKADKPYSKCAVKGEVHCARYSLSGIFRRRIARRCPLRVFVFRDRCRPTQYQAICHHIGIACFRFGFFDEHMPYVIDREASEGLGRRYPEDRRRRSECHYRYGPRKMTSDASL